MSQISSGHVAHLHLVIAATETLRILRHCARCKAERPFASSGKFRVNVQKKLIDVWLIWRCTVCDQTWNHAIHERRRVRSLPPTELDAFMRNDAGFAWHHAGLLAARMVASAVEERVESRILVPVTGATEQLEVAIAAPPGNGLRLDRVLATGLMLGRGEIGNLATRGVLVVLGGGAKALRRPAVDGQMVLVDLTRCEAPLREGSRTAQRHART